MSASIGGATIADGSFTYSWGMSPASGQLTCVGPVSAVTGGDAVLGFGGAGFYGVLSKIDEAANDGTTMRLEFVDNRIKLVWDSVYCLFNHVEVLEDDPKTPGIDRKKRYKHILPENWLTQTETITDKAYSAQDIIGMLLHAPTVSNAWGAKYHSLQARPVGEIDCLNGKKLGNALQEVSDEQGMLFTLVGQSVLHWEIKGEGNDPGYEAFRTSDRSSGEALSAADTQVRIVGDRNRYQVLSVDLEPDWVRYYESFWVEPAWLEEVATVFGLPHDTLSDNAALAAKARQVTMRDYATKKGATADAHQLDPAARTGLSPYADYGMWGEVSRMEIPVWIYLNDILFKAYRIPRSYAFSPPSQPPDPLAPDIGVAPKQIPLASLQLIEDGLLAAVDYTLTGQMSYKSPREFYPATKAFALVKGQQLSLLDPTKQRVITPVELSKAATEWSPCSAFNFDVKNKTLIFEGAIFIPGPAETPVLITPDPGAAAGKGLFLFKNLSVTDASESLKNIAVPNAACEISPAAVRVSLVWEAEKFFMDFGSGQRKGSVAIQGLSRHMLYYDGVQPVGEIPYADGETAAEKGNKMSSALVARQFTYSSGGYLRNGAYGTALTGTIDRVTVNLSFSGGITERVELSKERSQSNFGNERDLDRRQRSKDLYPGQRALKDAADTLRTIARVSKELPRRTAPVYHNINDVLQKPVGAADCSVNKIHSPDTWLAGMPVMLGDDDKPDANGKRFGGIVVADNSRGLIACATQGIVPVIVQGPIAAGDDVGIDPGVQQTARKGGQLPLGKANASYSGGDKVLLPVRLGAGSNTKVFNWTPYVAPYSGSGAPPSDQAFKIRITKGTVEGAYPSNMGAVFTLAANSFTFGWLDLRIDQNGVATSVTIDTGANLPAPVALPDPDVNGGYPTAIFIPIWEIGTNDKGISDIYQLEYFSLSLIHSISSWDGQAFTRSITPSRDPVSIFF